MHVATARRRPQPATISEQTRTMSPSESISPPRGSGDLVLPTAADEEDSVMTRSTQRRTLERFGRERHSNSWDEPSVHHTTTLVPMSSSCLELGTEMLQPDETRQAKSAHSLSSG